MVDPEEDNVKKDDFEARDYQVQLAEMAFKENKIIFLPTGSGKTFISTMVLIHFLQKNDCSTKKIGEGGKRGFFLVNTVALVQQQVKQIQNRAPFEVKGYSGDMGVDNWCKEVWLNELADYSILVMTAQIFLNLLLEHVISLKDVAVAVFDECHHAVVDHPMRQIMQQFKNISPEYHPRVLGLTATLLNKNVPVDKVEKEIRTLETTFLARIATADDENMVKVYSTNPRESKVMFCEYNIKQRSFAVRDRLFDTLTSYIGSIQIDDEEKPDKSIRPYGTCQIEDRSKKTNKELKNVLTDISTNMDDLGLYGGNTAILARLIQLQKLICTSQSETSKTAFSVLYTDLVFLRKHIENEMGNKSEGEKITLYSTDKLNKFLSILKKMKESDSAIVFVKRRFTAKIMHNIVSKAAKADPKLNHIKCDFVVGYNVTNPFKDTRENLLQRVYNDRVLEKFNCGLLNVLFGSNVVEEGMDIKTCNMVIMFDAPMDFRSYTQSKGRARHNDSRYIIMTGDEKYIYKYDNFKRVENKLRELICGGLYKMREEPSQDEVDATLFANISGLEPYMPSGPNGPSITALSAISHVNRYFLSLKTDKFTKITPFWFMESSNQRSKCYLHLPMESRVRGIIEGTWQMNKENAKRSVALEACKRLHQLGELDNDHLLPVTIEKRMVNSLSMLPNWDDSENFKIGTKRNKRGWEKKWPECLTRCMPQPSKPMYLHVIQLKMMYDPPSDNHRLVYFHETLSSPVTYAIVSSKPLPQLAPFPLFLSTGEVEVNIMPGQLQTFTEDQLTEISTFHGIMFSKVLGVVNTFLIRDYTNRENSYLIAPVIVGGKKIEIDWEVMEMAKNPFPNLDLKPTEKTRLSLNVNDDNYLGKIVSPWYRTVTNQKYIVTKVCYDMNEHSNFPSDVYATYKEYFEDKYKITPLKTQPLLEVRALSSRLNNLKPMSLTKALRRKNKDENEEFEVWLVPEFCYVYPVPGCHWVKGQLLPSVLYRVTQLCSAEELRMRLVSDINIGLAKHSPDKPLKKLKADASLAKKIPIEVTQLITPLSIKMEKKCTVSKAKTKVWEEEEEPRDIDRDMDVSLFDVLYYENFVNAPLVSAGQDESNDEDSDIESGAAMDVVPDSEASTSSNPGQSRKRKKCPEKTARKTKNIFTEKIKKAKAKFVTPPPLNMLQQSVEGSGPAQVHMLQAITAAVANDLINCERLETLGDSFLKFAVSLVLFESQEDQSEGALTNLKGRIVGNKNLYFCGRERAIGKLLEVKDFSPREEWIPPQFCLEYKIVQILKETLTDPSCLFNVIIPEEEVILGQLSSATKDKFTHFLLKADELKQVHTCSFTNQLGLTDKNIADAVEAIIGVYLENSGIFGALRVMNWFGVMDQNLAKEEVFTNQMTSPRKNTKGSPSEHLVLPKELEETLGYRFRDKTYLLQAVTHPSYQRNNITQCYQRLEFLGDAIVDFLITVHIYERCVELHPGDLTDLRSALVNNITLGCITVRHGLHRFLLHHSSTLHDIMARFIKHQEERDHQIDNDILFLCEERETLMADAVEVPKALGDLFEALVGAIYLDSGKDLKVAWKVIYNLMKNEIETFHSNVPKNHVRMLHESLCCPNFSSSIQDNGVVMVKVEVTHKGETITCNGFGDSKHQAKRAAAKHALRIIRGSLVK